MKSLRTFLIGAILLVLPAAGWFTGILGRAATASKHFLLGCLEYIQGFDPAIAALTFVALYIAATVLFLPGLLITMAAGLLFGVVKGTILVSIASVTGASLAFLIGRHLARDWVARKISHRARFRAIDEAIGVQGSKIVLLLRLSPVFPYNLLNYALGLTRISFRRYVLASWIGMLPGTLMYVYLGSLAGSLATLATGTGAERTNAQWVLFAIGLLATIAVTVFITRIAKRALDSQLATSTSP